MSKIEWTDETWNPVRGCSRVSEGCRHCYAEIMQARFDGINTGFGTGFAKRVGGQARWTGKVELNLGALDKPRRWRAPRRVFVNSMSDLWHEALPIGDIEKVYQVMCDLPRHTFQVLTKRPERRRDSLASAEWSPLAEKIWEGTSVEDRDALSRIDVLRETPALTRFLSLEPLLEDLGELNLEGIHWVIVGGESGPSARPMRPDWARSIRDQCQAERVPFFFKQWGKKRAGRKLDGVTWDEYPDLTDRRRSDHAG